MVKKESIEDMRELLNKAIKNNSRTEIFKISKKLDRHIAEYLYNSNPNSSNVKTE